MMLAIFFVYFVLLATILSFILKIGHREMNLDLTRKLPWWLAFITLCRLLGEKRHQWPNPALASPSTGPFHFIIQTCQARCAEGWENERIFRKDFLRGENPPLERVAPTTSSQVVKRFKETVLCACLCFLLVSALESVFLLLLLPLLLLTDGKAQLLQPSSMERRLAAP